MLRGATSCPCLLVVDRRSALQLSVSRWRETRKSMRIFLLSKDFGLSLNPLPKFLGSQGLK